jgi:hypothetical protein
LVVAALSGDPARQTFADLAAAAACAAAVVRPEGRIVLLSQGRPALGDAADALRAEDAAAARESLRRPTVGQAAAFRWADAACRARLYLLSGLADETVEELFATPLQAAAQAQRLIDAAGTCLFIDDAHKAFVELKE